MSSTELALHSGALTRGLGRYLHGPCGAIAKTTGRPCTRGHMPGVPWCLSHSPDRVRDMNDFTAEMADPRNAKRAAIASVKRQRATFRAFFPADELTEDQIEEQRNTKANLSDEEKEEAKRLRERWYLGWWVFNEDVWWQYSEHESAGQLRWQG